MTSVLKMQGKAPTMVTVRGSGDGMEMEEPSKSLEVTSGGHTKNHVSHSPRTKPIAVPLQSPGVLQLGKMQSDKAIELEAVRIVVPKAAITHTVSTRNAKSVDVTAQHKVEPLSQADTATDPKRELLELKSTLEKVKASEERLLQDKEGLSNQIRVQTEVNRELKKLLVASVGNDLQYHFERMAREKNHLILENEALGRNLSQISEQLERMTIQCDVWRSKFLASRVMAAELTNARAALQCQTREAQNAIQDLLSEREQFRQEMIEAHGLLEQLVVSLQWGRQQTYYPSAQPHSTAELASANLKLAKAVNSHLLGNTGACSTQNTSTLTEVCNTPAEKMAEQVLRILDPICHSEGVAEVSLTDSAGSPFLSTKKSIGRFHPYTRYENITFNCCNRCTGELLVL
ncbi:golgin-45 isoform X1 [Latimeria chalumnae]|uniref:Basic leucine zipper nuclear factor 1 n=1 Tax=Latimeria chalumnae TaxID=7897 RepID=H3B778_LATCH|nr:PREDICTED: golgin-45 isoform X1 [Latimeria chalumnae]XP_005993464.1 PREDICTED: golgin-45 isoform X1 [Latimeria chalumnae]|eukprot:XP_005993463.1 PREDICTED: golgin-45 isoform X1 [Latimeria chalumnae]